MAKKVFIIFIGFLFYLVSISSANILAKAGTWQMVGFGVDVNLSKINYPPKDNFSVIWMYDSATKSWKAFSKKDTFKNIIKDKGLWRDTLKSGDAFWIQTKQDTGFLTYKPALERLPVKRGWHLVSFGNGWWSIKKYFESFPQIKGAFIYRDNTWKYLYRAYSRYIGHLKHFGEGEGGWIYLDDDINKTDSSWNYFPIYNDQWNVNNDNFTFANKKLTFSNAIEIILDQNGSVITNIENLSPYTKWSVSRNGKWGAKIFKIYNDDDTKEIKYYLFKNWQNDEYILQGYKQETKKYYPNHTMDIVDENYTDEYNANINVAFSDYNKSHIINPIVKSAIDNINDLLENGNEDAEAVLNSAKNSLQNIDDNDAKVALAIINLIQTLDDPVAGSLFKINSDNFTLNGFFKPVIYTGNITEILSLKNSLSNYSGKAKTLLSNLADRLTSSAYTLWPIYQDKNYVFSYKAFGKDKLNYVDIKALRAAMMAVAFKLQFYASYDLGSKDWVRMTTEDSIEYRKISADPVGFLNSKTFLVNPNQTSLNKAKHDLVSFLYLYNQLLNAPANQREGTLLPHNKITYRNDKRDNYLMLKNLTDNENYPTFAYINDYVENDYQHNKTILKKETFIVNLNALFDANKTVTINDFPPFEYKPKGIQGIYDAEKSKLYNDAVDTNGNPISYGTKNGYTFTQPNHINNIFIKYIDEDGQSYTGTALLNKLVE